MRQRTLHDGTAATAGLSTARLSHAVALLSEAVDRGEVPGAVLVVARRGIVGVKLALGQIEPGGRRLQLDDLFLVASLTKPLVCGVLLKLVERGLVLLDDPVRQTLPELTGKGTGAISVRHLLTHTSGLPDMLPDNQALRERQAPLAEFVAGACRVPVDFPPGTDWRYQSMGILLASAMVERLTGLSMKDALFELLLGPLGLRSAVLGVREGYARRLVPVCLPPEQRDTNWHWNTDYWRALGAPWGGLHATGEELAVVLQMILNGGSYGDVDVFAPATAAAAVADQTERLPDLPEAVRRRHRWGFGWRLGGGGSMPDLVSPATFGHTGATGTIFWADPVSEMLCVLLTNQHAEAVSRLRSQVCAAVAASWL